MRDWRIQSMQCAGRNKAELGRASEENEPLTDMLRRILLGGNVIIGGGDPPIGVVVWIQLKP
jgi:hypothetical protein